MQKLAKSSVWHGLPLPELQHGHSPAVVVNLRDPLHRRTRRPCFSSGPLGCGVLAGKGEQVKELLPSNTQDCLGQRSEEVEMHRVCAFFSSPL